MNETVRPSSTPTGPAATRSHREPSDDTPNPGGPRTTAMSTQVDDVTAWLDRLEAAHKAATPGPWTNPYPFTKLIDAPGSSDNLAIVQCDSAADAAAIVAAHNALPALIAAIRRVLALCEDADARVRASVPASAASTIIARGSHMVGVAELRTAINDALA